MGTLSSRPLLGSISRGQAVRGLGGQVPYVDCAVASCGLGGLGGRLVDVDWAYLLCLRRTGKGRFP